MSTFLYSSNIEFPFLGGASRYIWGLFKGLATRGHVCYTVTLDRIDKAMDMDGMVRVHTTNPSLWAETVITANNADVVITQLSGDDMALNLAGKYGRQSILIMPSIDEYICQEVYGFDTCTKFCLEGTACAYRVDKAETVAKATKIIVPSVEMQSYVKSFYGRDAFIVYPPIDPNDHLVANTGNRITLIGDHIKGLDLFIDLAVALPQYKFLVVRPRKAIPNSNVLTIEESEDVREVWTRTKILLVPSIVCETFGMVCVEAGLNGIPCITSGKGGLVESSGQPGICVDGPDRLELWKAEIVKLMEDKEYYNKQSIAIKEHVKKFDYNIQIENFLDIVLEREPAVVNPEVLTNVPIEIKVSIVTSLYKSEAYLQNYFDNLAAQTYQNFEIIIICNDPTIKELEIIEQNRARFTIKVIEVPRESTAESVNRGLDIASGDYIHICAGDDLHNPLLLENHVSALDNNAPITLIYNDYERQRDGKTVEVSNTPNFNIEALKKVCYIGPHITFRKSVIAEIGKLSTVFRIASDYEYWLRLATAGYKFMRIPLVLSTYIEHEDALTYQFSEEMRQDTINIQKMYAG